jgi:hypothetical protein
MRALALCVCLTACSGESSDTAADSSTDSAIAEDVSVADTASDVMMMADAPSTCVSWAKLTVATVIDPTSKGAIGDGKANDTAALRASIDALPSNGGIVVFDKTFRKTDLLTITKPHVKLWSVNRAGGILGVVAGVRRKQATLCRADGCGVFGLKLTSDAVERFDALEDNQIGVDHVSEAEVSGVEIDGGAATGVFLFGSKRTFIDGNYIHHTWADHIHHTDGARTSWAWGNWILNEAPSKGDDGIACVTYGVTSPKCGDMEWWSNTILKTGWGRGYSVIGGERINIHDNWASYVAGAGVIVASEGSYNSASSNDITITKNFLYRNAQAIGHPGMLVSGENAAAPALSKLAFRDNVVVETKSGQAYRTEGKFTDVTNTGMSTDAKDLPTMPMTPVLRDTTILATRDTAWVDAAQRRGLYRVQVRRKGAEYEQRFEYLLRGSAASVGGCVVETWTVGGETVSLIVSPTPLTVPATLNAVAFESLRDPTMSAVWKRVDALAY